MASIANITNNVIDSILPSPGNPRINLPVWNDSQKMFITSEYESSAGNRYYKGIRFSDRIVIIEKVGLYHTWTYIDEIEVYTFNNKDIVLIGNYKFNKEFYNSDIIKEKTNRIVSDYIKGQMKIMKTDYDENAINNQAKKLVGDSYRSFLYEDTPLAIDSFMPILEEHK